MPLSKPIALTALVLMTIAALIYGGAAMSLEKPDYEVIYKQGDLEFRRYSSYLVAETIVRDRDSYNSAGNEGFRRLFRYITGNNRAQQEIKMTAPVAQGPVSEKIAMTAPVQQVDVADGWRVAFMLPSQFSLETAPVPSDDRVAVREVPGRLMAVVRYSGRWTAKNFRKGKARLEQAIAEADVETIGEFETALYDPPYKPPFLRRNEIMIEVSSLPESATAAGIDQGGDYAMMRASEAD